MLDVVHFNLDARPADATAVLADGPAFTGEALPPLASAVEALETRLIEAALNRADGNKARAAALLDISERTLWYKLKKGRTST